MGIKTLLGCILIVGLNIGILATKCPHPRTNTFSSHQSNSDSQAHRECKVDSICDCSATPASTASTSAAVTSTSASPSPSTGEENTETSSASSVSASDDTTVSVSNSTSGPCQAVLVTELRRIKIKYLTVSQQQILEIYIQQIEIVLLDITLTLEKKVIKCAGHLKICFNNNPDIEKLIGFVKITGWGRVFEFVHAGLSYGASNMKNAFKSKDNSGNCDVTQALEAATANNSCGPNTTVIAVTYIKWFKRISLKDDDECPDERKHALISKIFRKHIALKAPPALLACMSKAEISGFGTFELYMAYCDMFVSFASIGKSFLGGDADSSPLIQSLNSSINSNETAQSYNATTVNNCNNFVSNLKSYWRIQFDHVRRLKFVSAQFSFLSSDEHECLYKTMITAGNEKCQFSEFITASHYSTNNNITFNNQPIPQDYARCCKRDKNNNTETMQALDDFRSQLTGSYSVYNMAFNSNYNSMKNCINNNDDYTVAFSCVVPILKNCFTNVPTVRAMLMKTVIWSVYIEYPSFELGTFGGTNGTSAGMCGCS